MSIPISSMPERIRRLARDDRSCHASVSGDFLANRLETIADELEAAISAYGRLCRAGREDGHDVKLLMRAIDDAARKSCCSGEFNTIDAVVPWLLDRYEELLRNHFPRASNGHPNTIVPAPAPGKLAELIRKTEESRRLSPQAGGSDE